MNNLNILIEEFLKNYSFNNIEVLLNKNEILKLDKESLERKLIENKRGGYCFENNQYFYNELLSKGYETFRSLGRVVYGDDNLNIPRTHQISIVKSDGEFYAVDVGFGPYTPGGAIPLDGTEVSTFNGRTYRIRKINANDYQLEVKKDNGFFSLYVFDLATYQDADFELANYYTNTHPKSKFTNSLVLSQQGVGGTKFVSNLLFSKIDVDGRKDHLIKSSEEMYEIFHSNFSISYTEQECEILFGIVSRLINK